MSMTQSIAVAPKLRVVDLPRELGLTSSNSMQNNNNNNPPSLFKMFICKRITLKKQDVRRKEEVKTMMTYDHNESTTTNTNNIKQYWD